MKKITVILIALFFCGLSLTAFADTLTDSFGGALTSEDWINYGSFWRLDFIYTDTDGNGTTGIDIPIITHLANTSQWRRFIGGRVEMFRSDPGTPAPDDNYDIKINLKSEGVDCFQGGLYNRDTSATETGWPLRGYEHPEGTLQFVVENNSQAGAVVTGQLYVLNY